MLILEHHTTTRCPFRIVYSLTIFSWIDFYQASLDLCVCVCVQFHIEATS